MVRYKIFRVYYNDPNFRGKNWRIKDQTGRQYGGYETKERAVERARTYAKREDRAKLEIMNKEGGFSKEHYYNVPKEWKPPRTNK